MDMLQRNRGESHSGLPTELEAVLMIVADRPAEVADQIAELRELGAFRLVPQPTQNIHDVYFDTPDRLLAARGFGLRVRECGTQRWVTLKGQSGTPVSGPVARFELELPWQRRHLHRIAGELSRQGIALSGRIKQFDAEAPAAVMRDLGLEAVQRRSTERVRRNVVPAGEATAPTPLSQGGARGALAELAIDAVRYHLETRDVLLYEVEIEAGDTTPPLPPLGKGGLGGLLVTLCERLLARFGTSLRSWNFSKLATGAAIAELDASGALEGRLHPDGTLTPAAVEKIAEHFMQRGE